MSGSRSRLPRRAAASDQDTACPEIARKCEATVGLERPLGKPGGLFSCIAVHFNRGAAGSSLTWLEDRNEQRPTEDRRGVPLDHRTGSLQSQPATVSGAATIGLDTGTFPPSALPCILLIHCGITATGPTCASLTRGCLTCASLTCVCLTCASLTCAARPSARPAPGSAACSLGQR